MPTFITVMALEVEEKRSFLVSLLSLSNQDRELQKEAVLATVWVPEQGKL